MTRLLACLRADIVCGVGLLTRMPVGWLARDGLPYDMTRCVWTWPVVGALCGVAGAMVFVVLMRLGISPLPCAVAGVAAQVLLTGGLHEDGLADMADGFGGGATRARKLEIMRDSRIGSYGMMALALALMARVGAIGGISPALALVVLPVAGALARTAMVVMLARLPPARADGIASGMARVPAAALAACLLLAAALSWWMLGAWRAAGAMVVTAMVAGAMIRLARRQIGGQTGDVLGAGACLAECALLMAVPAFS
ncbi:adenosylcobinamide-GDP ribazoletransferase [Novacetimonas pomaceti]|uniref:Adenosylcobinamide-GDP ribazoletransferase n=1 Tax=Novacetimonas pomaceti TaxID=2021998 RepID=A0ABX5P124_9PROT|nr:adenosylcobinamide-GDP ribazoletransferase [Novacetimonas pomaceti]PYD47470.1 adenosylcobinamide-GDP ribazoletransferase [Novacetimonas pomaceti]